MIADVPQNIDVFSPTNRRVRKTPVSVEPSGHRGSRRGWELGGRRPKLVPGAAAPRTQGGCRMGDIAGLAVALPDTESAVRRALEAERRKLRAWAISLIRDIEDQRDLGLRRLDRAASVLAEGDTGVSKASGKRKRRRSRKRRGPSAAAVAENRRQAMHRFLVEQGRPTAFSEIHRSLRLSEFSARSVLKRLMAEGAVARVGTGSATRYQARSESLADSVPGAGARPLAQRQGTMQGRLLATLEDRGSASLEELAQAVRASREEIEKECGALIREEEIHMARRDGRAVYVSQGAA
jgi:hypothetical protein